MMKLLSLEARVALQSFLASFIEFFIIGAVNLTYNITSFYVNLFIITSFILVNIISVKFVYKGYAFQIALRSSLLGAAFSLGIYLSFVALPNLQIFGPYLCIMAFFHYSEFLAIALIQPKHISIDSFILNHSPQYIFAAVFSCIEFFTEAYFFPWLKQFYLVSYIGICICIGGEILRKAAMFTAGSNFNHLVQCEKANDHVLVTHGVYSLFRHPSYVGWFYWSIGTQIVVLNPVCLIGYVIASWTFFNSRIYIEEITLLNFFGQQYCDYQEKVGTGIPLIQGYRI